MNAQDLDASLVPLAERVRWLQRTRLGLVTALLIAAALGMFEQSGLSSSIEAVIGVGVVGAVYLVLTVGTLLAPRLRRPFAIALSGAALLLDGVVLGALTYGLVGFGTALITVVHVHCVAVTLLSSFRTGLKVAVWHTLVMTSTYELQRADGGTGPDPVEWQTVLVLIGALWLVTLATASFAAVNEREIRRRNVDLIALTRLSMRLEESLRPTDMAAALLAAIRADLGVERALLLGVTGGRLERLSGEGDSPGADRHGNPARDVMIARAIAERRTLLVPSLDSDRDPWLCAVLPDPANLVLIPVYADGALAGLLIAEHRSARGSRVQARVVAMLERCTSHTVLAVANATLLAQMRRLAETDGLTGVANRRMFDRTVLDEVQRSGDSGSPVSLVLVDLDNFKRLNDVFGHQRGDVVLRQTAAALVAACRPSDMVARYGGEEFAVILPDTAAEGAESLSERLRLAVATAASNENIGWVTASFGVAVSPDGQVSVPDLIRLADQALYRSKANGRNRVTVDVVGRTPVPATSAVES